MSRMAGRAIRRQVGTEASGLPGERTRDLEKPGSRAPSTFRYYFLRQRDQKPQCASRRPGVLRRKLEQTPEATSARFRVLADLAEIDHHARLVADNHRIVAGRNGDGLVRADFRL